MPNKPLFVDLFAGCGGLSLGLKQAGFALSLAVEKSDMAAETFYHNHVEHIDSPKTWSNFSSPDKALLEQAKKRLIVKPLDEVLACGQLMQELASKNIDLVAGGPPCQGFSLAGRRKPDDDRNKLVWQFLDFVTATKPKAVVIENVVGMRYAFRGGSSSSIFDQLKEELSSITSGYVIQPMLLNAMHFGVPQHRPRVFLVGLRKDIAAAASVTNCAEIWKSKISDQLQPVELSTPPPLAPIPAISSESELTTVKDAISDLTRTDYSSKKGELSPYAIEMRTDQSWMPSVVKNSRTSNGLANHQIRRHCGRVKERFRLYQALSRQSIPLTVISIPKRTSMADRDKEERILDIIQDIHFPLRSPDRKILAESKEEIIGLIFELATKKHSQHPLQWANPSHTVLSLPDDFVHPEQPRTMTVREMARFQSFPDAFEFRSRVTTGGERRKSDIPQYTQVANAVPPKLAKAIGAAIKKVLEVAEKNKT